jgi:adenylate kinase
MNIQAPKDKGRCDACRSDLIQRDDDKPEVIRERIKVYHDQTEKLIRYYQKKSVFRPVNGEGTVDSIFLKIAAVVEIELAKLEESRVRP